MAQKKQPSKKSPAPKAATPQPDKSKQPAKKGLSPLAILCFICVGIILAGAIVYWPALSNDFTNWDDPGYVTQNFDIKNWSSAGISHLFHSYAMGNYHPLTMLSLAWDYHLAQLKPFVYHRDSIILHILASIAVAVFTWLISRNVSLTAICGLLFVIHPMHVESVAWVAGRKDVLFGLFYFLALIAYYYFATAKKNKIPIYVLCLAMFLLSLLSKGIAVTLPISCLLVDYLIKRPLKFNLLLEKLPMFIISVVFGIISIKAQQNAEAIQSSTNFPIFDRPLFASYAFLTYIGKLFLPIDLCNFYPYPTQSNGYFPVIYYVSPIIVIGLLFVLYRFARKNKSVLFGFLFYASAIFLLLQFLPVGTAIIADRYSYIAYFGLFFILGHLYIKIREGNFTWGKSFHGTIPFVLVAWFIWLGMTTRARCEIWKNTETLWRDAISKQPDLSSAYNNLGFELYHEEKYNEALPLFTKSIKLLPTFALPYANRGEIYRIEGKNDSALADFNKAISLDPKSAQPYVSRAVLYCIKQKLDSAGADFANAVRIDPNLAEAYSNRGNFYDMKGQYDSALADYAKAISLKPEIAEAYQNRANALIRHGNLDAGIADLNTFLQLKPESGDAYLKRSQAYFAKKDYKNAFSDASQAQSLGIAVDANYLQGLKNLAK